MSNFKKVLAIVLAATCMLTFSFSMAFAAGSPTSGNAKDKSGNSYTTYKSGNAAFAKAKASKTTVKVAKTVTKNGYTYKITTIKSKAFNKSKAKKVRIYSTNLTKVSKSAFKGSKVNKSKIKVYVTKKMSSKNFKKLKKALKAAGIKSSNIKRF